MRVLFFIFVMSVSVFAQASAVGQTFEAGNNLARERKFEQAVEKYRTAAILANNERSETSLLAKIHFNIGVCLYHLKKTTEAVGEYTEAIKLSRREYQKAFYALGLAQKDLGNWQAAENALRDSLKIEKNDGEAWFDLALVYLETENYAAAKKAFENAIKHESVDAANARNNLGVIAALNDDWNLAERQFETALLESNGKSVAARGNLRFCKLHKQNIKNKNWTAKLEFIK